MKTVQSGAGLGESDFSTRLTSSLEMNLRPFSQQAARRAAEQEERRGETDDEKLSSCTTSISLTGLQ